MLLNFLSTDPTHRKDYYKILGVSPNADQKQIKKAYFDVSVFCLVAPSLGHSFSYLLPLPPLPPFHGSLYSNILLVWPSFP